MKKHIHSLAALRLEIDKLTAEKEIKEVTIKSHFSNLKENLKPANLLKSAFASFSGNSNFKNELASKGTEAALGFIVSNLLFRKSNFIVKAFATIIGTSFASKIFGDDSSHFIDKIKNLYQKFVKKSSHRKEEVAFNEEDIYRA